MVAKPVKPANYREVSSRYLGNSHSRDYFNNEWDDPYEFSAVAESSRVVRSTSGFLHPYPGTVWKPCNDYLVSSMAVSRPGGRTHYKRGPIDWGEGPRFSETIISGPASHPTGYPVGGQAMNSDGNVGVFDLTSNIWNRIDTELMVKVGARKTSYGEALGESKQTLDHMAKTAMTLFRGYKAARKGNWGQVAREFGVHPKQVSRNSPAAQRWLEYQYGWLPLMGDIYDSYNLFKKGLRQKAQIMKSVRVQERSYSGTVSSERFYEDTWKETIRYSGKVYYKVKDSELSTFHQIGLINPLEVAWALTPWSFVVDWFLPIGNVLEAATAAFGVEYIDGCHGCKASYVRKRNWPAGDTGFGGLQSSTHTVVTTWESYRRQKMTGFPLPRPYFKDPFSSTHVTSALALFRQLIK